MADIVQKRPWLDKNEAPLLKVENVTKQFDSFTAVNDVSLDVYSGELFCLLGGSGCGKSTLLRMLAGFESPSKGRIIISGQDMASVPPNKRPTNMMFQSYALFPHMTVLKNVTYGLRHGGMSRREAEAEAMEMLRLVKLEALTHRRPHQLSGGQRQRVALARALVKKPKLLLLDEPLGALDKKLREDTQFELIRIQETLGVTFIVVTHDQEEAMTLATRIAVMHEGKFLQVGEPREAYEFPHSRHVANFLGAVNLFEGTVVEDKTDHVVLNSPDVETIHVGHGISCTMGQTLWVAVRPEKLELSKKPKEGLLNQFQAEVDEIGYLGNVSVYFIKLQNGRIIKAMRANREREPDDTLTWGDQVYISWSDTAGVVLTQ